MLTPNIEKYIAGADKPPSDVFNIDTLLYVFVRFLIAYSHRIFLITDPVTPASGIQLHVRIMAEGISNCTGNSPFNRSFFLDGSHNLFRYECDKRLVILIYVIGLWRAGTRHSFKPNKKARVLIWKRAWSTEYHLVFIVKYNKHPSN